MNIVDKSQYYHLVQSPDSYSIYQKLKDSESFMKEEIKVLESLKGDLETYYRNQRLDHFEYERKHNYFNKRLLKNKLNHLSIYKVKDEWFHVRVEFISEFFISYTIKSDKKYFHYKCDQFSGLIELITDLQNCFC